MTTTAPKLHWREIPRSLIDIPREYVRRTPNDDADKRDAASVAASGIHQPLTVIPNGKRFTLVKGTRRIGMAEANDIRTVPVIVNYPPAGLSKRALKAYRDKLRNFLFKRQDLRPSEEVAVIEEAQRTFNLNNKEIAALLHVDPATITNKRKILTYAKPIVEAIDRGDISLYHASAFDGLRPQAQLSAFKEFRNQLGTSGAKLRKMVRKRFDPAKHARLYADPERTITKRQATQKRRKPVSKEDLHRLESDLGMLQAELDEGKREIERANRVLQAFRPIHMVVTQDNELADYVAGKWPQFVLHLERASEI